MFKKIFSRNINIPTLRLSGVIGQAGLMKSGLNIASLDKQIDKLFADKKSPAVALIINSPGGSPTQSSLIAEKIINNQQEIQSLSKTRDTLLPKLMSGQVRVNNIKQTANA